MKKSLSLVLAVMMLLGCVSITAFAATEYDLYINDVQVTDEGEISNAAITDGTVTYTAAEHNNGIAKLTLNGATIVATSQAIETSFETGAPSTDLEIELIGTNTVTSEEADAVSINGNCIITGSGSLNANGDNIGIYTKGHLTLGMSGTLTAIGAKSPGIESTDGITVNAGAGKVKATTNYTQYDTPAIVLDNGELTGHKTIVGSADANETDESKMASVVLSEEIGWGKISKIEGSGDFAKTVVLTSYPTPKSGSTSITFTKEKPKLAYTIVIPTATTLTEESHKDVQLGGTEGKASVEITTGDDKTNIYYTVDLTNATLTDGTNEITTTYAYAQGGDYSALTDETKVTVYKSGTVQDSTVQVTADETSWTAAPAGTYTASVVFNFGTEEIVTVGDVLATAEKKTPAQPYGFFAWVDDTNGLIFIEKDDGLYLYEAGYYKILPLDFVLSADGDDYKGVNSEYNSTITFKMTEGKLTSIQAIGLTQSTLTFVQTEVATLVDVLDTAANGFPTAEESGWTNGTWTMFKRTSQYADENMLIIKHESKATTFSLTTLLFTTDGGYKYINPFGTYTLHMEAGHLTSFTAQMQPLAETTYPGIGGTYHVVK